MGEGVLPLPVHVHITSACLVDLFLSHSCTLVHVHVGMYKCVCIYMYMYIVLCMCIYTHADACVHKCLWTSLSICTLLSVDRIAVFSITVLREERVVVVAEQRPTCTDEEAFTWMNSVVPAVESIHNLNLYGIVLVPPGRLPRVRNRIIFPVFHIRIHVYMYTVHVLFSLFYFLFSLSFFFPGSEWDRAGTGDKGAVH